MIRVFYTASVVIASALAAHAAEPAEITIEKRPFTIRQTITATALPEDLTLIGLKAAAWSDFEITRIAPHGSRVSKGDVLVAFDPEKIDQKLHDARQAIEARDHEIAQAGLELKHLEQTTPHRLEALRRAAGEAKEENAYFANIRRKAEEEAADQKLKRAEMLLENQREELRQLQKMYAADDLTEETEEIILVRQKDRVQAAEFDFRMQQLASKRSREVLLPRETVQLAEAARDTAIALAKFEEEAPRAISRKKLELETLKTTIAREKESLAKLEADRKQFEFTAPADGWFYHGAIENGRWTTGDAAKSLVIHGRPAIRKPFATFIPATAKLKLVAALKTSAASQLCADVSGVAWLAGREDAEFPVKLTRLATAPDPDGQFAAEFSAQWSQQPALAPAAGVSISLIAYEVPAATVLPVKALEFGSSGWTVAVKLADGKTERRAVKRGRVFNDECEILSGLEPGQVVVVP
jgi:multidrug efflux pump subunit AcrA (membrane-fusion protein)